MRVFGKLGGFGDFADLGLRIAVMTMSAAFRKPFGANPSVFLTSGASSFGDLYIEGHRVGPAGVLDDELVLAPSFVGVTLTEHRASRP